MTFRHIECAIMVAEAGSINKASRAMLVSQPYLSGMINSLEKELGYPIFDRSSRGITCTSEGREFIKHAETIMSEVSKIKAISDDEDAPLKVATYYSRFVTELFLEFHNKSDAVLRDRYREMGNMEVIEAVAKREYGIGIIYHARSKMKKFRDLAEKNNLEYITLYESMNTYLIMSKDHPLAKKDIISHDDLKSSDLVFFEDASTMLYMVDHLKLPESATDFSVSDRGAFMDALASSRYLSVINTPFPELEQQFMLKDVEQCMPEDADFEVGSAILLRRDHKLTAREKEFLKMIRRGK